MDMWGFSFYELKRPGNDPYFGTRQDPTKPAPPEIVYTDGIHLWSASIERLHEFAQKIGLKRDWFQIKRRPHYDLTTKGMAKKAEHYGAFRISQRELILLMKENEQ